MSDTHCWGSPPSPCNLRSWPSSPVCPREQQPGRQTRMSLCSKQHPAHPDPLRDPAHWRAVYVCPSLSFSLPCCLGDKLPGQGTASMWPPGSGMADSMGRGCRTGKYPGSPGHLNPLEKLGSLASSVLLTTGSETAQAFYPMFFGQDHFFEELFCICIQLVNKTWKEMRATQEDFDKVRGDASSLDGSTNSGIWGV